MKIPGPDQILFIALHMSMRPSERLVTSDSLLRGRELRFKRATVNWLVDNGWITLTPTGHDDERLELTPLALANRKTIMQLARALGNRSV